MKKTIILLFALLSALCGLRANDSMYYTVGSQLVPLQATDISLNKERLTITILGDGTAQVDVRYELFNPGKARTVRMGFEADPPYMGEGFRADGVHPYINDFQVEVNGANIPYKNAIVRLGSIESDGKPVMLDTKKWTDERPDEYDMSSVLYDPKSNSVEQYAYAYYFDARFEKGTNTIHHTYRYQMSVSVGSHYWLDYKLTPALRWAGGKIGDFTLVMSSGGSIRQFFVNNAPFGNDPQFTISGTGKQRPFEVRFDVMQEDLKTTETEIERYTQFSLRNASAIFHATDFQPAAELHLASADNETFSYYGIDYNANEKQWRKSNAKIAAFSYDSDYGIAPLFIYSSDEAPLSKRLTFQLPDGKLIDTKRILRNMPFAARGYVFKDKGLRRFFESCWWYMPDPNYKADMGGLNKKEQEFINSLK